LTVPYGEIRLVIDGMAAVLPQLSVTSSDGDVGWWIGGNRRTYSLLG
jgi:hypothetical protein